LIRKLPLMTPQINAESTTNFIIVRCVSCNNKQQAPPCQRARARARCGQGLTSWLRSASLFASRSLRRKAALKKIGLASPREGGGWPGAGAAGEAQLRQAAAETAEASPVYRRCYQLAAGPAHMATGGAESPAHVAPWERRCDSGHSPSGRRSN
jgi:hypothetical protein